VEADTSLFVAPRSLLVTSDCNVWVVDPRSGVWRWPCDTNVPAAAGSAGQGPGEFEHAWFVGAYAGDTIAVYDRSLMRLTLLHSDGELVRTRSLLVSEHLVGRLFSFSQLLSDGSMRLWTTTFPMPDATLKQHRSYVLALRPDGTVRDSIARFDGMQSLFYEGDLTGRFDAPLQRKPFVVFLKEGGFIIGNNDHARLDAFDADGRRLRTISLPLPPAASVTSADRKAYADSIRHSAEDEMETLHYDDALRAQFRTRIDQLLRDVQFPATRQRYDQLVLDDREQAVWVLPPAAGTSYARTWFVCTLTEMSTCRTVAVPHSGAVVSAAVRNGTLYTIERTQDGLSRVAKYEGSP
jgi:hypothetical protein